MSKLYARGVQDECVKTPVNKAVNVRELVGDAASKLRSEGIESAVTEIKALVAKFHHEISLVDRLILLAGALVKQSPKHALEICDYLIKSETKPPIDTYLIAGTVQDRLGDRNASKISMTAVINSMESTPAQKLAAANLLVRFGEQELALESAKKAFVAMGRPLNQVSLLLYIAQKTADWPLVDELTLQLRAAYREGRFTDARESPRTHLNWCANEQWNLEVIRQWNLRTIPKISNSAPQVEPLGGRRIRVGYLSSDFREHPLSRWVKGLFRHHNKSVIELYLYCVGWDDGSNLRKEVLSHADHLFSLSRLSDQSAADLIRSHKIDILVDLNGPTRAHRLGILAQRPAPIQIHYIGFPGSVGGRVSITSSEILMFFRKIRIKCITKD